VSRSPKLRKAPSLAYRIASGGGLTFEGIDLLQRAPWVPVDGANGAFVTMPNLTVFQNWSIACWATARTEIFAGMNVTSSPTYGLLLGVASDNGRIYHHVDSDNNAYAANESGAQSATAPPNIFHIAATQQYTVGCKLYLNGAQVYAAGVTGHNNAAGNGTWFMGKRHNNTANVVNRLQGFGFWAGAVLAPEQVAALAESRDVSPATVGSPQRWFHVGS